MIFKIQYIWMMKVYKNLDCTLKDRMKLYQIITLFVENDY